MVEATTQITVTVKLFAAYLEVCGTPELVLSFPAATTAEQVGDYLRHLHPELEPWREVTRYGVNLQFVSPQTQLQDGDELVLIPPVSGG